MTTAPENRMNPSPAHLLSQLQATLEATLDGIVVVDRDGKIKTFSRRFQQILGIPDAILASGDICQVVAFMLGMMAAPDVLFEKLKSLAADFEENSFDTLHLKDGRVLEVCCRPQRLEKEIIGRVWTLREITERYRAEKALRESRGVLDAVINGVSVLMVYVDPDWRFRFVNRAYANWYGVQPDELAGKRLAEVLSPALYQAVSGHIEKALTGQRVSFATQSTAHDGARGYFDVTYDPHFEGDRVIGVFASIFDITERTLAEQAVRKAEERLKFISDKIPVLFWQKNRDGVYLQANKAFCDIHGRPESEIVGKTDSDIFEPQMAERFAATDRAVLESGRPLLGIEDCHERPPQAPLWSRKDKYPYFDAEGRVAGTIGFAMDLTEDRKTKEALRQSEKLLQAQHELEANNKKLEELNTALNYLLEKRKSDEINFKEQVTANISHLIYPFLENIESRALDPQLKALVGAVRFNLEQITSQFSKTFSSVRYGLTPTEIKVADLIRNGVTGKDIAKIMGISYKTVEVHRNKIRKKLGITRQKTNLRSFLLSIE
ncbi:MAG: PAS domain-containing protein [Desulfobacteraceae bacterium]|jgi:PAS domain S-box-containing protein|nr:PAS domain-containing protein [Desulfobacteraceae bacterium]